MCQMRDYTTSACKYDSKLFAILCMNGGALLFLSNRVGIRSTVSIWNAFAIRF